MTPAVELIEITKAFPGVVANDHISLAAMPGEVLCLLGENGAGKSTLMSILSGIYRPDDGRILVRGQPVTIESPRHGRDLGIGMVYQHLSLIPTLHRAREPDAGLQSGPCPRLGGRARQAERAVGRARRQRRPRRARRPLALGQQQQVEIIKALWKGSQVLILDEPTSMLTPQGIAELQGVLRGLKQSGLAIIFITHKLHEAIAIGDRVVVLKQGRVVGRLGPDDLAGVAPHELQKRIVTMMFGDPHAAEADIAELREESGTQVASSPAIRRMRCWSLIGVSAEGSRGQHGIEDVSLAVRGGEILGVAGVDGSGQRALAEVVAGQRRQTSGTIRLAGASIDGTTVSERQRLGLRYVTDDRLGEGVVSSLPGEPQPRPQADRPAPVLARWSCRPRRDHRELPWSSIEAYDIRTPSPEARIGNLSGGNIQKALLARELSFDPGSSCSTSRPTGWTCGRSSPSVNGSAP